MKIRQGDLVQVLSGKDRGKQGRVIEADPVKQRVIVENLNLVKRHRKPRSRCPYVCRHTAAARMRRPARHVRAPGMQGALRTTRAVRPGETPMRRSGAPAMPALLPGHKM